jgi:aspartate aminotransferase
MEPVTHQPWKEGAENPHGFNPGINALENEGAYAIIPVRLSRSRSLGVPLSVCQSVSRSLLPSHAEQDVERLTKEGHTILNFGPGQPDFPTPQHVKDAGCDAIQGNQTTYVAPSGTSDIKGEVAKFMNRTRNLEGDQAVQSNQVVVGPGAKPPLFFAAQCLLQPGDEMLIPDPGFPVYKAIAQACHCTYKFVPWNIRTFDLAAFEAALNEKTRIVIINSPSNPTGGVMPEEDLDKAMALVAKWPRAYVFSDEIYSQLTYDGIGTPKSALNYPEMRDRTVAIDGFSKTYCMTGWRLGWAVMPEPLATRCHLYMTHTIGCSASFTQIAGIAALAGPQDMLTEMREEYQTRRNYVVGRLNAMPGVSCATPEGAFYVFPNISGVCEATGLKCKELAKRMLFEHYVVCLPGTDFGAVGEGHLRYSYVRSMETLIAGMDATEAFFTKVMAEAAK